jgi:Mce-associated membrane protein
VSPRRRIEPESPVELSRPPRRWSLALAVSAAGLVLVAALAISVLLLVSHEKDRRTAIKNLTVVEYVRSFMAGYTSPDPFHANDYADRVLAQATGEFAKGYQEKMNELVVRVAMAQPTSGTVTEAGVEKWNDDGSANVLVAATNTTKSPDGKTVVESGSRWVVTAIKEGDQWKISNLIQVI